MSAIFEVFTEAFEIIRVFCDVTRAAAGTESAKAKSYVRKQSFSYQHNSVGSK